MTRGLRRAALIWVLFHLALLPASATAYEDAANGKRLAERWCAECHLVTPGQAKALADVPPFATIASRPDAALENLTAFLADPHPRMPNPNLTRQEIADIVAYIRSLR